MRHGAALGLQAAESRDPRFSGGVHLLPATRRVHLRHDPLQRRAARRGGLGAACADEHVLRAGRLEDGLFLRDGSVAGRSIPECTTVSLVCAWFFNSEDASACNIYPSTNYLLGEIRADRRRCIVADHWRVSGLTEQDYPGIIPLPALPGTTNFVYGGTPSDPSIVRCIQDLKARGFQVVFYPFLLGHGLGLPLARADHLFARRFERGDQRRRRLSRIGDDRPTSRRDKVNLTVGYSGEPFDWTYRRMILHYANLCVVAGGVNLFVIGSELRGLETIRGPGWTQAGTTDGSGKAIWDYPFVAGLIALADDVRSVFDGAGLTKNLSGLENLVTYSADWSSWMGWQHPGENGQWPHLDQLWAHANIDLVVFDNYLPLSDWTTGGGGLDVVNWSAPAPSGSWPPSTDTMNGLGLSGMPTIYSIALPQGEHRGRAIFQLVLQRRGRNRGQRPRSERLGAHGVAAAGDRLAQARNPYYPNQQILANKQFRWWWNNTHQAVYDDGDGRLVAARRRKPSGSRSRNRSSSSSMAFRPVDKATNQPNVFFDAKSTESATPFWSIWDPAPGMTLSAEARRHDRRARARGDLRILEHRRPQRDLGRRRRHGPVRTFLRLELGRAAVSALPDRQCAMGRCRQLAGRRLVERRPAVAAAAGAEPAADAAGPIRPSRRFATLDGRSTSGRNSRR